MRFRLQAKKAMSLTVAGVLALGCSETQGPPDEHPAPLPPTPFVVSSPVPAPPSASASVARSVPDAWTAVYVSLPPGTISGGHTATILDERVGSSASVAIVDGGFDPAPLVAEVGDTLSIAVQTDSGSLAYRCVVAAGKPPIVVRTSPPPHKRDIALNARMVIVFSTPIDSATLNSTSIQLWRQTTPVSGDIAFGDPARLTATFAPDSMLAELTDYELRVSQDVRGFDGAPLKAPVSVPFTTEAASAAPLYSVGGTVTGLVGSGLVLLNDGGDPLTVTANGPFSFATTIAGGTPYAATVLTQPANPAQTCVVTNGSGTVADANITTIAIACTASGSNGILRVTVVTTGPDIPANDTVAVDYGSRFYTAIAPSNGVDSLVLTPGAHRVGLAVAQNCTVTSPNFVLLTVVAGAPTELAFSVTCVANGTARVTVATSGPDAPSAYSIVLGPIGFTVSLPFNGTASFALAAGVHEVVLLVPQNCTVTSPNDLSVTASAGATTDIAFGVTCVANGTARVTVATTGPDAPSAFSVHVGPVSSGSGFAVSVPSNGTVSFALALGTHSVSLPIPSNCTVAGADTLSVTVAASGPTEIAFSLTCAATSTGILRITETTTGRNGPVVYGVYATRIPPAPYSYTDSTRGGVVSLGVAPGRYVVNLRLPPDCTESPYGPNVTVVSGGTTSVPFTIACGPDDPLGYTVGGRVTGLVGSGLVLRNNGGDDLAVAADGPFTFATPLANGSAYSVTVSRQPGPGQFCGVSNGAGRSDSANIAAVAVACAAVPADLVFTSVTAGTFANCGVTAAGAAYCWGDNRFGSIGDGTTTNRLVPVLVAGGVKFTAVTTGGSTCGVTAAGAAYCWGENTSGQLGIGTTSGPQTCILYPCSLAPAAVAGGLSFAEVTANGDHACGITAAGTAYCWGDNQFGMLGIGSAAGPEQCINMGYPGGMAFPCSRLPVAVAGGLSFARLSAGGAHTCGVTAAGAAYCWGYNIDGQVGDGTTTNLASPVLVAGGVSFAAVAAGNSHSCGLTPAGAVYCWGNNGGGQLGDGTTSDRWNPEQVLGGVRFAAVTAGDEHTCGITGAGAAYCWGYNAFGQLGDGTTTNRSIPVLVAGGLSFAAVTAGNGRTCGVTAAGAAYCWGGGGLGDGTTNSSSVPVKVAGQP